MWIVLQKLDYFPKLGLTQTLHMVYCLLDFFYALPFL